jgi:hypothetical protein
MASESGKDLAVIIVSWNVKDVVLENLRSIFTSDPMPAIDIILVDNASSDGTADAVRETFPSVRVIANKENHGFAAACNQGLYASSARHALLLNPDMRVEPNALSKTVNYLDAYPNIAVLGPKLVDENGKAMHHMRRFPRLGDQLAVTLKLVYAFPKLIDRYLAKDLDLEKEQDVDSVRGSFFAINRAALDAIGLLDEKYFIWFEEVDYCRRVKEKGMSVRYVPSIVAHDLGSRSFAKRGVIWKQKQFRRSMLTYFRKWYSPVGYAILWLAWALIWPAVLFQVRRV